MKALREPNSLQCLPDRPFHRSHVCVCVRQFLKSSKGWIPPPRGGWKGALLSSSAWLFLPGMGGRAQSLSHHLGGNQTGRNREGSQLLWSFSETGAKCLEEKQVAGDEAFPLFLVNQEPSAKEFSSLSCAVFWPLLLIITYCSIFLST